MIAFEHFDWIKKLCGNWDDIKKYFKINQCERWISCVNFCLMTVLGVLLIYGITKIGLIQKETSSNRAIGINVIDKPIENMMGQNKSKSENTLSAPTWVFTIGLCYVLARLILSSATLLTTNLNEKWLSILPGAAMQLFILGLIITSFGYKSFDPSNNKIAIGAFILTILLSLILPFIILRIKPTNEEQNNISFKFGFSNNSE
jgi:hypothetical protein